MAETTYGPGGTAAGVYTPDGWWHAVPPGMTAEDFIAAHPRRRYTLAPQPVKEIAWTKDDGGRAEAGFQGSAGDCACRAAAIATGRPYRDIYEAINLAAKAERPRDGRKRSSARDGVHAETLGKVLEAYGFTWTPTMAIGSGCTVHLDPAELPTGRIVARLSKHYAAVIDGVLHDTYDSSRNGTRCVYGFWKAGEAEE